MPFDFTQLNWDHFIKLSGFTDAFIAEKIGVSRAAIGQFRRKEKRPSKQTAKRMAALLKESLEAQKKFHQDQLNDIETHLVAFAVVEEDNRHE